MKLLQPDMEWTSTSPILIELSRMCRQYAFVLNSVLGISIKENDTPIRIAQKILRQCFGLAFQAPVKRGAKGHQQRCYPSVEITPLRQSILEAWYLRDSTAKEAKAATQKALKSIRTPSADPPAAESKELGVELVCQSLDSDVEVGTTGNITTIPVVPTESGAYQDAANGKELEQLVEALPFCETVEDLVNVIEGCAIEVVEDAIAMQDTQPRRIRLTEWLEEAKTEPILGRDAVTKSWGDTETFQKEIETPTEMEPLKRSGEFKLLDVQSPDAPVGTHHAPRQSVRASERHLVEHVVPRFKVGDVLERLSGGSIGKVAQVLQVFRDWLNTSLGAVTLDEIKSGSWRIIGST
jgi:hypothetical protein